ncbi:hypothetical protein POM88_049151 [Heracleum sosnowskyi]|uniref:Uncharacterized protein n=1 Tax=Heracleum sosnowskyi TaxID=360622 RepID=A0AAD8GV47_9APIA|nr:hypothetical protein POM88_049151 [Heracleum sosnowskyi]
MRGHRRLSRSGHVHGCMLPSEGTLIGGTDGLDSIPDDSEIPNYEVDSMYFSIKVNYDGDFDEGFVNYFGWKIEYFDMCSMDVMLMSEINVMLTELGVLVDYIDLWFHIPGEDLLHSLLPIETPKDLSLCLDLLKYTKLIEMYTTPTISNENDVWDFSFTQYALDEKQARIDDFVQECDTVLDKVSTNEEKFVEQVLDDEVSFHGDSSNFDSSESESEKPKPKKEQNKVPPPNPPYRARKNGRFSVLIGLHNNKEDAPIKDDTGPSLSQPRQQEVIFEKVGCSGIKKSIEGEATGLFTINNIMEKNRDEDDGFSFDSKYHQEHGNG